MIYTAAREDLPEIVAQSLNIPKEHGFENLPSVDIVKVNKWFFEKWLESPIFVYKGEDGTIQGFVGTQVTNMWWSDDPVINDFIFYVVPEYRSLKVFNALLDALIDMGKLNDMPVICNFMSNDRTELKEKAFERKGFKKSGIIMTYGI